MPKTASTNSPRNNKSLKELDILKVQAEKQEATAVALVQEAPPKPEGNTRHWIAISFVVGYLTLFAIILIGYPIYNLIAYKLTDTKDLSYNIPDVIQMFASATGPLIGFVLGYYFKAKNNQ